MRWFGIMAVLYKFLRWARRHSQGGMGSLSAHRPALMLFSEASASIKVLDNPNMQLVAVDVHNLHAGFLLVDKVGEVQWRNVRVVAFLPVPEEIARR